MGNRVAHVRSRLVACVIGHFLYISSGGIGYTSITLSGHQGYSYKGRFDCGGNDYYNSYWNSITGQATGNWSLLYVLLEEDVCRLAHSIVVRLRRLSLQIVMAVLISFAIGLAIGYLSLALGNLGVVTMTLFLALLIAYYLFTRRIGSASAVAIGAGSTVTLLLGSIVLSTLTDPAVHTELPTYAAFIVGLGVLGGGLLLGIVAIWRRA